jgi:hypothetical protein
MRLETIDRQPAPIDFRFFFIHKKSYLFSVIRLEPKNSAREGIASVPKIAQGSEMSESNKNDLGFIYRILKQDEVQLFHHGRLAATLRRERAQDFLAEIEAGGDTDAQQMMARLTGNYKRSNERTAKNHPRNRG